MSSGKQATNVIILSGHDQPPPYTQISFTRQSGYAQRLGYSYECTEGSEHVFARGRNEPNDKFFVRYAMLARALKRYEWALWLDSDVVPLKDRPLDEVFDLDPSSGLDLQLAPDFNDVLNSGVMLWHRSVTARELLDEITQQALIYSGYTVTNRVTNVEVPASDQGVLKSLLLENFGDSLTRVRFVPAWLINAHPQTDYWQGPTDKRYDVCDESLFMHMSGLSNEARLQLMKDL